jgi:hypothetical protein
LHEKYSKKQEKFEKRKEILNDLNRRKEIRDEEMALLRHEIDIEVQEMDNEKEQLHQIKEDLRRELMKNTQYISNLNSVKDKQPVVQQQQTSQAQPAKSSIQETEGSDDEEESIALQAGNSRTTRS